MNKLVLFIVLITALAASACSTSALETERVSVAAGAYMDVEADGLKRMLEQEDLILVNVHTPFVGNIPGTDFSVAYDQIDQNLGLLPAEKDAVIVLYCQSGRMSTLAAEQLVALGYTNVFNLKGGMMDWERAGYLIQN